MLFRWLLTDGSFWLLFYMLFRVCETWTLIAKEEHEIRSKSKFTFIMIL